MPCPSGRSAAAAVLLLVSTSFVARMAPLLGVQLPAVRISWASPGNVSTALCAAPRDCAAAHRAGPHEQAAPPQGACGPFPGGSPAARAWLEHPAAAPETQLVLLRDHVALSVRVAREGAGHADDDPCLAGRGYSLCASVHVESERARGGAQWRPATCGKLPLTQLLLDRVVPGNITVAAAVVAREADAEATLAELRDAEAPPAGSLVALRVHAVGRPALAALLPQRTNALRVDANDGGGPWEPPLRVVAVEPRPHGVVLVNNGSTYMEARVEAAHAGHVEPHAAHANPGCDTTAPPGVWDGQPGVCTAVDALARRVPGVWGTTWHELCLYFGASGAEASTLATQRLGCLAPGAVDATTAALPPGRHVLTWVARDAAGRAVALATPAPFEVTRDASTARAANASWAAPAPVRAAAAATTDDLMAVTVARGRAGGWSRRRVLHGGRFAVVVLALPEESNSNLKVFEVNAVALSGGLADAGFDVVRVQCPSLMACSERLLRLADGGGGDGDGSRQVILLGSNVLHHYHFDGDDAPAVLRRRLIPDDAILYNFEPLPPRAAVGSPAWDKSWVDDSFVAVHARYRVWDYSSGNVARWTGEYGLDRRRVTHVPVGHTAALEDAAAAPVDEADKEFDVLFDGTRNGYRRRILEALAATGLRIEWSGGWGAEHARKVARARVVLSLSYFGDPLEHKATRFMRLLPNRAFVVSQLAGDDADRAGAPGVHYAPLDALAETIHHWLRDPVARRRAADEAYERWRGNPQSLLLLDAVTVDEQEEEDDEE